MSKSKQVVLAISIGLLSLAVLYFRWDLYYSNGMEGSVLDSETSEPIVNAQVKVTWREYTGASYHGSKYYSDLVIKESVTDRFGRFVVTGWWKMLGANQYFDERSPTITIVHPNYQPYNTYTRRPYQTPWFGFVNYVPIDDCRPDIVGSYFLDSIKKAKETVNYSLEEISGSLKGSNGNGLSGVRISIEVNAVFDSCTNMSSRTIAEFNTLTNADGSFDIPSLDLGTLEAGYKIPIDQPRILITCRYQERSTAQLAFYNAEYQYFRSVEYFRPGSIKVNWHNSVERKTKNKLTVEYKSCLRAEPEIDNRSNRWITNSNEPAPDQ